MWVDKVWKSNHEFFQDGLDVKRYLFEQNRIPLDVIRPALMETFGSTCFYCGVSVVSGSGIDHVLPLSKVPINGWPTSSCLPRMQFQQVGSSAGH
jgi:hypothetical protein